MAVKAQKQPQCPMASTNEDSVMPWWKELGIPKSDVKMLPEGCLCVFCQSAVDCDKKFGEFLTHSFTGIKMHYFCLLLSSGLVQSGAEGAVDSTHEKDSIYGFLIKDIIQEIRRAAKLNCSFCRKKGASIGCVVATCKKKYHFPCGLENGVLSQFYSNFSSYCKNHRPTQQLNLHDYLNIGPSSSRSAHKKRATAEIRNQRPVCPICLCEIRSDVSDFQVIKSTCCSKCWLHRACVQQQAFSCGMYFFRCPICNSVDEFNQEMKRMGIYIPDRDASWEMTHDAYNDLLQRHSVCDVANCKCPHGRDYNEKSSGWSVVLCDLCGSSGTHVDCSDDVDDEKSYFACQVCLEIHGSDGARSLAVQMGVISPARPAASPLTIPARRKNDCDSPSSVGTPRKRKRHEVFELNTTDSSSATAP